MPTIELVYRDESGWCVNHLGPKGHTISTPILTYIARLHDFYAVELPMLGPAPPAPPKLATWERQMIGVRRKRRKPGRPPKHK